MGQIFYQINSGYPNFTAHIEPNIVEDQTHSATGLYSFNDIPEGNYSITITDAIGCEAFFDNISITTTTTTTVNICDYNGVLNVGVDETTYGYIKDVLGSLTPSPTVHGTEVTGVYYEEGYLYVDILSSEITIDTIIINSIEYIITDGVSEPIDNPFEEELDYNICVNASICSPEIWICGSGEVNANGGYCNVGITNGKMSYVKGDYTIFWYVQSDIEYWVVRYTDSTYLYYSEEDVLTPDLVSEWYVGTFGTVFPETAIGQLPLPNIITESCSTVTTTTTLPEYKELSVIGGETYSYIGDYTNVNVEFDTDLALLFINTYDPVTRTYSIPNIGGVDMTEIGINAGINRAEVWYLFDPPKLVTAVNISGAGTIGTVEFTLMYITTTGLTLHSYDILHQFGSGTSISQTISKPTNSFNLCLFNFVLLSALVFPELVEGVAEDSNGAFYPTIGTCFRATVNGTYENACISFRMDNDIDNTSSAVLAFTNAFNWQSLAVSLYAI